jgi:hypothetical protein
MLALCQPVPASFDPWALLSASGTFKVPTTCNLDLPILAYQTCVGAQGRLSSGCHHSPFRSLVRDSSPDVRVTCSIHGTTWDLPSSRSLAWYDAFPTFILWLNFQPACKKDVSSLASVLPQPICSSQELSIYIMRRFALALCAQISDLSGYSVAECLYSKCYLHS